MKTASAWLPPILWMALIFAMSALPGEASGAQSGALLEYLLALLHAILGERAEHIAPELLHLLIRKGAHMAEYAVLALLNLRAFRLPSCCRLCRYGRIPPRLCRRARPVACRCADRRRRRRAGPFSRPALFPPPQAARKINISIVMFTFPAISCSFWKPPVAIIYQMPPIKKNRITVTVTIILFFFRFITWFLLTSRSPHSRSLIFIVPKKST